MIESSSLVSDRNRDHCQGLAESGKILSAANLPVQDSIANPNCANATPSKLTSTHDIARWGINIGETDELDDWYSEWVTCLKVS